MNHPSLRFIHRGSLEPSDLMEYPLEFINSIQWNINGILLNLSNWIYWISSGINGHWWDWVDLNRVFVGWFNGDIQKNGAWTVKKSILGLNVEKMDENGALPRNGDEMEATYC